MIELLLDVTGGDHAPDSPLAGAALAYPELERHGTRLILLGDETVILAELKSNSKLGVLAQAHARGALGIEHTPEVIGMGDSIKTIRSKENAPITWGCRQAGLAFKARASSPLSQTPLRGFVSAGHSGAVMAAAVLHMGRIRGIERPAIGIQLPTQSGNGCLFLDAGANVDCTPEQLRDFALMGASYAQGMRTDGALPKVGLLSNGEESSKGTELTRAALALIEASPAFRNPKPGEPETSEHALRLGEFLGYVEGKEIFKGGIDVVVTDGFVGNVVLKSLEGLGSTVVKLLRTEAKRNPLAAVGFFLASGVLLGLKRKLDYAEYGAAPLFGISGYAFICHGRSNPKAMKNALLRAETTLKSGMVERLTDAMTLMQPEAEASRL